MPVFIIIPVISEIGAEDCATAEFWEPCVDAGVDDADGDSLAG